MIIKQMWFATNMHSDCYENGGGVYGFHTDVDILIRDFPNCKRNLIDSDSNTYYE